MSHKLLCRKFHCASLQVEFEMLKITLLSYEGQNFLLESFDVSTCNSQLYRQDITGAVGSLLKLWIATCW